MPAGEGVALGPLTSQRFFHQPGSHIHIVSEPSADLSFAGQPVVGPGLVGGGLARFGQAGGPASLAIGGAPAGVGLARGVGLGVGGGIGFGSGVGLGGGLPGAVYTRTFFYPHQAAFGRGPL